MSLDIVVNPTMTGGTTVQLGLAGVSPGKSTYVFPDHDRTRIHTIETTVGTEGPKTAPIARTGVKFTSTVVTTEEGCCTVSQASTVFDLGVRYNLIAGNDSTKLQADVAAFRAFVESDEFFVAIQQGIVPST